jgi:tetrahydromethanopterin S-methyltransferase subunit G
MEQSLQVSQELGEVKRDVAVLDVEVQNFKKVMERLDEAISAMSRVSANVEKLLVIHEERIKNNDSNLAIHKSAVEDTFVSVKARLLDLEKHKQMMETLNPAKRLDTLEEKMEVVSKWRWQLIGAWSVIAVIAAAVAHVLHLW